MGTRAEEFESKPVATRKRLLTWIVLSTLLLLLVCAGAVGAIAYWRARQPDSSSTSEDLIQSVSWRTGLFARKATGKVPDLTWGDLFYMIRQPGGFGLVRIGMGMSPDGSVRNPFHSDEDLEAGVALFNRNCSSCHGTEGGGWNAPTLNRPGLRHGDSDLAIYKVMRDGIPGTAMHAANLSRHERWQVVGYLRTLMLHGSGRDFAAKKRPPVEAPLERIAAAGSQTDEWLTYSGSFDGRRYSPLNEITPANVSRLRVRWIQQFNTVEPTIEATPIVLDGTIFTTEPPSNVVALDAGTGAVVWRYDRPVAQDLALCCGRQNRGLALLGHTLFLGALDGYLVAIDANTGKMLWETRVADYTDQYSMTGAPLIVGRNVVTGVAGGDFGTRGFVAAYDVDTGKLAWKFDTVPGPGQPGNETWGGGDAWQTGGGATWTTGSYDPDLDLLYWGVGNPAPDFNGDLRPGDNLYTNSVVALQGSTGELVWHFQFTPHDEHDWDSTQTPILTDLEIGGATRKVILWANRNGFYYILDRTNGKFLTGTPFVEQNWAKGLDENGRPTLSGGNEFSNTGRLTRPAYAGGTNWQNAALDSAKGLFFVHATEGASVFTKSTEAPRRDKEHNLFLSSGASTPEPLTLVVRALDVATGAKKWEYLSAPLMSNAYAYSGLLATGGGLVFGASGGSAFAVDSATGKEAWRVYLGGDTRAAPITFTVDGHQVIAISAGRSLFLFGL